MKYATFLMLLAAGPALASPYCVEVTGVPPQCLYADPNLCQADALRQHGRCGANAAELKLPNTNSPYCVAESGNVISCAYPDQATCRTEALRHRGACIAAPTPPALHAAPDPYALTRPF